MDEWSIRTEFPIYTKEMVESARKMLIAIDPEWAFACDEAIMELLDRLGFREKLIKEFDKALLAPLNPELPASCNYFRKDYPPIDWKAIGVRVGKLYFESKRRPTSNVTTK